MVSYGDYPREPIDADHIEQVLTGVHDGVLKSIGGQELSNSKIVLKGRAKSGALVEYPGRDFTGTKMNQGSEIFFGWRIYLVGRRLYQLAVIINKADLPQSLELAEVQRMWPHAPSVVTSILTGRGLPELEETIANLVLGGKTLHSGSALVTSTRHREALRRAAEHLRASLLTLQRGEPLDFVSIDLHPAYDALGEITGETASDDLLDKIFSEFCIGK